MIDIPNEKLREGYWYVLQNPTGYQADLDKIHPMMSERLIEEGIIGESMNSHAQFRYHLTELGETIADLNYRNITRKILEEQLKKEKISQIQRKPTDEEIRNKGPWGYSKLSDFSVDLFKGSQLFESEPDFLGDYRHVGYFDPSVKNRIQNDKLYKCWYSYSDAHDPADRSEYFYFAYIEEVPKDILEALKAKRKVELYLCEK